jgi:hypothetical protein
MPSAQETHRCLHCCCCCCCCCSDNDLTGPLPVATQWRDLTTYQLSDNGFTGRLPLQLCLAAHILETLDLSRNELTGALPNQVGE